VKQGSVNKTHFGGKIKLVERFMEFRWLCFNYPGEIWADTIQKQHRNVVRTQHKSELKSVGIRVKVVQTNGPNAGVSQFH